MSKKKESLVYCIRNKINGKRYFGKANSYEHYKRRIRSHKNGKKYYINRAIRKYGWHNFSVRIFKKNLTEKQAFECEIYYIDKYNSNNSKYGYNLTNGGEGISGYEHSKETREKMSKAQKGNQNSLGCIRSKETREKISKVFKGQKRKPFSKETRVKMSKAKKGNQYCLGHIHSKETREKMSKAQKGNQNSLGCIRSKETREKISKTMKRVLKEVA